ncbi:MAG: FAD:protein FMN transferase [Candidatus Kerfeldbacteria bacterium]|nr:FAD:protein FMN transferase [Candidatus Kerfeldbacteria bacterium]
MKSLLDAFPGLGTLWWIDVEDALSHERMVMLKGLVIAQMKNFEETYSRFKETSLLSTLNREKFIEDAPDEFIDMLMRSQRYERMTRGLFSIAVGGVLERLGYGLTGDTTLPLPQQLPSIESFLTIDHHTVRIDNSIRIDLGGIGKAYLIERLADSIRSNGVKEFLINGGGDILVESSTELHIEIEHPTNPELSIASIPITHGAICTSSPFKRAWKGEGNIKRQHIIHPHHTQETADTFQESATVRAPTTVDADVFATVCVLLGSKRWDEIAELAPLFHADVLLCSGAGIAHASENIHSTIH